jgi:hypothetical protein
VAVDWLPVEEFKDYARNEIPTADDAQIENAIDSAVDAVGGEINRSLTVAGDTATARVFRPKYGRRLLFIDDCVAVTSVTENGSLLVVSTDYVAEPLNGIDTAGHVVPYSALRRFGTSWYVDDDKATVSVLARWGWASIPPQLVTACKIVAKDVLMSRDVNFGIVAVTEAAAFSARTNPTVRVAVDRFHLAKSIGG